MIEALCNALNAVNDPEKDDIYQVTVRRGVPADAFALLGDTFEWYPVGGKSKKYVDMSEDELAAAEAKNEGYAVLSAALLASIVLGLRIPSTPTCLDQ